MLTALIHSRTTPGALAATLSGLVPAVAEGLVSHAVVALPTPDPAAERIADAMGATLILVARDPWREAAQIARGAWVLLLDAGEVPDPGWIAAIERHFMAQRTDTGQAAVLPLPGWAGLKEGGLWLLAPAKARAGLVAPRAMVAEGACGRPRRLAICRRSIGA